MGPSSQRGAWSKAGTTRVFTIGLFIVFFLENPIILGPTKSGFICGTHVLLLLLFFVFALKPKSNASGEKN